ncbi:MAG: polymer-forming cytoskeletal protein [Polyangiaceae bacterium]|nr:polymer-forming cytoskeletal protein [Polyangiaceae bacterium]
MQERKQQMGDKAEKCTLIEEGTKFKGSFESTCPVLVRGRVEGEVETPSLTVSASGAVHGQVRAGRIQSEGELSGEFDADSIELAGAVRDNTVVRAQSLKVELKAQQGKMQIMFAECESKPEAKSPAAKREGNGNGQSQRPPARHSEPPPPA